MGRRNPTSIQEAVKRLRQMVTGINNEPNWPAAAPTSAEIATLADELDAANLAVVLAKADLAKARATARRKFLEALRVHRTVDEVTDFLYGSHSALKQVFGIPRKGRPMENLKRLVRVTVSEGTKLRSLRVDWDAIDGAVYEVKWFRNPDFQDLLGSGTATKSEYQIERLTSGEKVWITVRAMRGDKAGPWSTPRGKIVP